MRIQSRNSPGGYTLLDLLMAIFIVAMVTLVLSPYVLRPHVTACHINCVNNLKQIGLSFRAWALDNGDKYPPQVSATEGGTLETIVRGKVYQHFQVMSNELSTPKILACPEDRDPNLRVATTFVTGGPSAGVGAVPYTGDTNLSYFASVDARSEFPQAILSGDKQLSVDGVSARGRLVPVTTNRLVVWSNAPHGGRRLGNVAMADGSVKQVRAAVLLRLARSNGLATNRLAVP